MNRNLNVLEIHTDGACSGNQNDENVGGWGAILKYNSNEKELFGGEVNTTNNRMELMALLRAFQAINKPGQNIVVFSDSAYLVRCFNEKWYEKWLQNGWKNTAKKPVENKDLWEQLLPFLAVHTIEFNKVKGHVNLNSKSTNFEKHFEKFIAANGTKFSYEDFIHATEMNNRADALANRGIDLARSGM